MDKKSKNTIVLNKCIKLIDKTIDDIDFYISLKKTSNRNVVTYKVIDISKKPFTGNRESLVPGAVFVANSIAVLSDRATSIKDILNEYNKSFGTTKGYNTSFNIAKIEDAIDKFNIDFGRLYRYKNEPTMEIKLNNRDAISHFNAVKGELHNILFNLRKIANLIKVIDNDLDRIYVELENSGKESIAKAAKTEAEAVFLFEQYHNKLSEVINKLKETFINLDVTVIENIITDLTNLVR